jgi:electron-transferring-flavoprotein dehydrogenase
MPKREVLETDVLFVGAGPASLSGALHLLNLVEKYNQNSPSKKLEELQVVVIEKGESLGSHILSGAVLNPVALKELIPDFEEKGCPLEGQVMSEEVCFLTENGKIPLPFIPPTMRNHGNYICTLGKLVQWLGKLVEDKGGMIFTAVSGWDFIVEDDRVVGVVTGDKGVDKEGNPKSNFEPGIEIRAKITVLGEGPLGTLTRKAVRKFDLQKGKFPQTFATSVKEVWRVQPNRIPQGHVIHTMGYPLKDEVFGGGFIYALKDNQVSLGLVVSCAAKDPFFDTQATFQNLKTHPFVRRILEGGEIVRYGAKTIPEGGYFAIPKLSFPGGLIIGDSAGLVNVSKLKGIHYAMKSGMLAAETILEALTKEDFSQATLDLYEKRVYESYIGKDLYKTRYFKAAFEGSFKMGLIKFGIQTLLGGVWYTKGSPQEDRQKMKTLKEYYGENASPPKREFDEKLTFKKLTDVFYSGTKHEENQPVHLRVDHFRFGPFDVCSTKCVEEYGNPCQYFCPANVYEMEKDEKSGELKLRINAANCVHCKTCDIMDPYNVIEWVPPEGGGGPAYLQM